MVRPGFPENERLAAQCYGDHVEVVVASKHAADPLRCVSTL